MYLTRKMEFNIRLFCCSVFKNHSLCARYTGGHLLSSPELLCLKPEKIFQLFPDPLLVNQQVALIKSNVLNSHAALYCATSGTGSLQTELTHNR